MPLPESIRSSSTTSSAGVGRRPGTGSEHCSSSSRSRSGTTMSFGNSGLLGLRGCSSLVMIWRSLLQLCHGFLPASISSITHAHAQTSTGGRLSTRTFVAAAAVATQRNANTPVRRPFLGKSALSSPRAVFERISEQANNQPFRSCCMVYLLCQRS